MTNDMYGIERTMRTGGCETPSVYDDGDARSRPRVRCATLGYWVQRLRRSGATLRIARIGIATCILFFGTIDTSFAQRNLKDIPDPDPEIERKSFIVARGFEVNLYAGDPHIAKPIQMNFDAEGKLWIASSETYPHIKPGEKANDKILVLEDTDADGKVDKTTVFADDLLIPTGILPGDGGCYVVNSTELLHLKDTDADGKADVRRVVLSGFGSEDTHHLLHSLRWGVDGAIYMNQSIYIHSHVETPHGVKRLNGGGIWRFRPDTMQLDVFCRGFVNPWGHHQDRFGQSFATDGAYGEGINYVFPGAIFVTAPGEKRRVEGLNPGSPKHCGLAITSGRHLPPEWRGNMITNDFRAHRVCRFVVTDDGSGYASRQVAEVIKSTHVAFRPIDVKMGPDGAIYIADWYNPIIQHGEVDFRDERRDHVHGRIWRVTAKDRPLVKRPKIVGAPIEDLLDLLLAPEDWTRLWAKQELKTRDHDEVYGELAKWIEASYKEWAFFDGVMLEIQWLEQTLSGVPDAPPQGLLESAVPEIRAAAVRITSAMAAPPVDVLAKAVRDEHPRVRLEGLRALAKIPSAQAAEIATEALDQPMDRFLDFALWQAMRDLEPLWLPALQKGEIDFGGNVEHLTFALRAVESPAVVGPLLKLLADGKLPAERTEGIVTLIAALGGPKELKVVFDIAVKDDTPAPRKVDLLSALADTAKQRRLQPEGDLSAIAALCASEDDAVASAAALAIGTCKLAAHQRVISDQATAADASDIRRRAFIEALGMLGDKESLDVLEHLASYNNNYSRRQPAIAALLSSRPNVAADKAVNLLQVLRIISKDADPGEVVRPFLAQKNGPAALSAALKDEKLNPDIAKLALRATNASAVDVAVLQAALRTAGELSAGPKKYTPEEIAALVADVKAKGDPRRGEAVYRRREMQCMNCHAIGGAGGIVGPDLISIGASAQVDYLIESLVDPKAKVKENFHSIIVETDDGKVYSGIPIRRTTRQLVLRDQHDKEVTLAVASIEDQREGRSLMPEGLIDPLTRDELIDLTAFLSQLGKDGEFAVGKQRLVRRWRKLIYTDEGHRRLNRTSHDTAATDDPALTWEPAYTEVSGELPLDDSLHKFVLHRGHPPVSFVRFEVHVSTAGEIGLDFGNATGLTLWVDGKPAKISSAVALPLEKGTHTCTLAIDRQQRKEPLRVELTDVSGSSAQAALVGGK